MHTGAYYSTLELKPKRNTIYHNTTHHNLLQDIKAQLYILINKYFNHIL